MIVSPYLSPIVVELFPDQKLSQINHVAEYYVNYVGEDANKWQDSFAGCATTSECQGN